MITIVSGLPRSGTSLMMRMLDAGGMPVLTDGIRAADVDNPRGYYEFEPVKHTAQDGNWLQQADGKAVKMIYKLLEELPADREYRVIFMQRALKEVVVSQNRMLERRGRDGAGGSFSEHRLVGILANEVAACRAWLAAQPHIAVHYVNYNRLLAKPDPVIAAVIAFRGGPLDAARMRAVIDPNLYRCRMA